MKLPRDVSGQDAVKAFEKTGWSFVRQKGSHMILTNPNIEATLAIPNHKYLGPGLLKSLIRDADLTLQEFIDLL